MKRKGEREKCRGDALTSNDMSAEGILKPHYHVSPSIHHIDTLNEKDLREGGGREREREMGREAEVDPPYHLP